MAAQSRWARLGAACCALLAGAVVSGCAPHPQNSLAPESDYANQIQDLFLFTCVLAAGVFLIIASLLVYSALRFRGKPGDPRPPLLQGNRNLEIAWTAAPFIVLTVIAVPTVRLVYESGGPAPAGAVQVTAIGHQWWFEYQYPEQHITTANEMHIPVGQPVNIGLQSADVIHSFWVPKLAGKRDMIPNHTNYIWFTPQKQATYDGQCAEFCGISHANMGLRVVVESPEAFAAWVRAQQADARAPVTAQQQAGAADFATLTCASCHTINGTSAQGTTGPNLTHVGSRGTIVAGLLTNTPDNLGRWLADPEAVKPGNLMGKVVTPGLLTPQQISDLTAYLESLQ